MKRLKCFAVLVLAVCSAFGAVGNTAVYSGQIVADDASVKIVQTIIALYHEKDLGESSSYKLNDDFLSDDIKQYLIEKIAVSGLSTKGYGTEKENYKIRVKLLESIQTGKNWYYSYQVETKFNLTRNSEVLTTKSEQVEILYDPENGVIVDFYCPTNYYDMVVRDRYMGEGHSMSVKSTREPYSFTDESKRRLSSLNTDISNNIKSYNLPVEEVANLANNNSRSLTATTINSTAVANYARNNYNEEYPESSIDGVDYFDFSEIQNSFDCTNFVSHALVAGGARMYDPGEDGISSVGWYFRDVDNRSNSWSGVPYLHDYLVNNEVANTAAGNSYTYTTNGAYWGVGTVMQFKYAGGSRFRHSTIITLKERSSDGTRSYAYVTGRTNKVSFNNNEPAEDVAPNGEIRIIQVFNN